LERATGFEDAPFFQKPEELRRFVSVPRVPVSKLLSRKEARRNRPGTDQERSRTQFFGFSSRLASSVLHCFERLLRVLSIAGARTCRYASDGIHFWLSLQGSGGLFTFF